MHTLLKSVAALAALSPLPFLRDNCDTSFTSEFFLSGRQFSTKGDTLFFPLQPGAWWELEGDDGGTEVEILITVTNQTRTVMGIRTRVVIEQEWEDDELVEVSHNFLAVDEATNDLFYFGELVDNYEDGQVVDHDGSWIAGTHGALPGILMPGTFLLGARYYQEVAPGIALDKAEHCRMGLTVSVPAGTFTDCVEVEDTDDLDPTAKDLKYYAPGIGLIDDDGIQLVDYSIP